MKKILTIKNLGPSSVNQIQQLLNELNNDQELSAYIDSLRSNAHRAIAEDESALLTLHDYMKEELKTITVSYKETSMEEEYRSTNNINPNNGLR